MSPEVVGARRLGTWISRWWMVPTAALAGLTLAPLALSVAAVFVPWLTAPVIALDLVLAGVALFDLTVATGKLEVGRTVAPVQAVGRSFVVGLRIRNLGRRALALRATDDAPGATVGLPVHGHLASGDELSHPYELTVERRGRHVFGDVVVRFRSPLGLWEAQHAYQIDSVARVYPDFARLRETGLRGRLSEERAPHRARRRPGGENEFQRLRPYVPGDPYRHIDWKATARKREFVTREFGQESNQNLIFLLDCGRMMSERYDGLTAFDHALNAAILLGQVALRHGDRVGLLAFDRQIRVWLPPKAGGRHSGRLIRATYDLEPTLDEPDYALAFRHLSHHVRRRSMVVLLTAVVDQVNGELASALVRGLSSRHLAVSAQLRDTEIDALVASPAQGDHAAYVRAAAAELVGWRERELASLRKRGVLVVDSSPSGLTPGLLHRYLEVKARRLL
ncbi:MAG: DUF58 domain-containing protein [Myxococcota bacterium]